MGLGTSNGDEDVVGKPEAKMTNVYGQHWVRSVASGWINPWMDPLASESMGGSLTFLAS